MKLFSDARRPVHMGPYPLERLKRRGGAARVDIPRAEPVVFSDPRRESIVNAMGEFQAMMDAIRTGPVNTARAEIPADPRARAEHLKAFGYFSDASMVGIGPVPTEARLAEPWVNPEVARLAEALRTRQTKTLASGIDVIMAELKEAMSAPPEPMGEHPTALVFLIEHHRDPKPDEPGYGWIAGAQAQRACLRGAEIAVVLAQYIRLLGWQARAHTGAASDVDLALVAEAAGLTEGGEAPWLGERFGLACVTTDMELAHDRPLAAMAEQPVQRPGWWLGMGHAKSALNRDPYRRRDYAQGAHPFETLKRVDEPTTYIDEARVARVPKRADMFARAQFGDMGKSVQDGAKGGHYARKAAPSFAQRRALGAFVLLQDGEPAPDPVPLSPEEASAGIKAASYFLGVDAVGVSRCPDWTWYSHDARGDPIVPSQGEAVSMIVDQGFETMEGASGDDWISVAQSMRAYLRFSLLGGVIAKHLRNLGYAAKAHTVMDGEVLQPPLLLLSGLGEVSRIGEVILNPFLGPRLKSGVVTTDLPLAHDRPIDFGLQRFCESCNKCARECPSGAITAGPKLMFNGYEIWKSDSQKCATYRITTPGGAMCGRCMKTCPWNLEGLFAERPFRWAAMNVPAAAPVLAKLDDAAGRGGLNDVKKWWWDIELQEDGAYRPSKHALNRRGLQKDLDLRYEDQTLAVYPAPLAPPPWPYPFPMDREAGIEAYQAMVTAREYKLRLERGDDSAVHRFTVPGDAPVLPVVVAGVERLTEDITRYVLRDPEGRDLPEWTAGGHLDIVVAPEFLRQYSMCGDPADRSQYEIAVLREDAGEGGSALMHRIFSEGRRIFISKPIKHFDLVENAPFSLLMGGGIGITPMVAFAHRLHALGRDFALHYSVPSRARAGFEAMLKAAPWAGKVQVHVSEEGTRADLPGLMAGLPEGAHVYTCGPDAYMDAVMEAAEAAGVPEEARHLEYFSVPEAPEYENHPFTVKLSDGRRFEVAADQTAADVLNAGGCKVDVKCSDGICGVCKARLVSGEVEHRDFVLSKAQRKDAIILCQSRAAEPGGEIEVEL
ncbi:2Fe-2S iron-sulfur cluster-binding protein [Pseudaestuariivita atlantica]|uniref:NAD-binding oxidoreductase n=1 Tax=Pseudaestuariivita atlantica TaxID=1317121 RepID=A0A0L1JLH4_9RHOB|nr:reductive dehalogenase domain-containing protein [Pseudaestuariivita atlantica]KNG92567.1 NAD-binding oxidoreductase [Pseudaestuariivita atlantica]